jgi:5-methylcytosine-specific restriction endonuclease McrA
MAKTPPTIQRPECSFTFYPREWIIGTWGLSLAELGRLFTRIVKAVDERDDAFLATQSRYVGRIYWRDWAEQNQREPIPQQTRRDVFARDGAACVLCGSDYKLEIDHYIPYSRGGSHALENLRVLCKPCNRRKGASMPEGA